MSTFGDLDRLSAVLFGKTRRRVLAELFGHPDQPMYVRQLARATGAGLGAIQQELHLLCGAGILTRSVRGHQVYYQADRECPVFNELRNLIAKTVGAGGVLAMALGPLAGQIDVAIVFGSIARGGERRESDVNILVVGTISFADVVTAIGKTQEKLGREVNPVVYPPDEFRRKLAAGHHFLSSVLRADKLFLIGDEDELARLAEKRLAD